MANNEDEWVGVVGVWMFIYILTALVLKFRIEGETALLLRRIVPCIRHHRRLSTIAAVEYCNNTKYGPLIDPRLTILNALLLQFYV